MQLVINLSMLSGKRNGQNVYSEYCADAISKHFRAGVIAGEGKMPDAELLVKAPASIGLGKGKLAAIKRQFWMRSLSFGSDSLVYTPSHHGPSGVKGQIITIHDLMSLRFPNQHRLQHLFFKHGVPMLLKKCRAVFTVSETSRQDIAETYRYPLDRIFVVPNGVDASQFSKNKTTNTAAPYLLMVGAGYPHKNVHEVIQMARYWAADYRLLVLSCNDEYKKQLLEIAAAEGVTQRIEFLYNVSQDDLVRLYQDATALVYASKWEGFGIPPLEALACGTPVIASDIPVHREVLGDSAFFVRLGDADSWQKNFQDLADSDQRAAKLAASDAILRRFTWQNSADILQKALLQVEPKLAQSLRR